MNSITQIKPTDRIKKLREYYLNNSPMHINESIVPWHCHRSLLLYSEGWLKYKGKADTLRLTRSYSEKHLLENMNPVIIPGELIVGQPDYSDFNEEEQRRYDDIISKKDFMPIKRGRGDHLAMDYQLLLDKGVDGIIKILDEKICSLDLDDGTQIEKYEFYLCARTELEGLTALSIKYRDEALRLADVSEGKKREEYLKLYEVLSQVPLKPARTFREALQSIHMFTWSLFGIYSFGKPDVYLLPYYRKDIENGIMTKEFAQELIDSFVLQSVPNMSSWAAEGMMLGGRDKDGNKVENELTWHFLNAISHTHLPDPNIGFCVTKDTGRELVKFAVSLIKAGHTQPSIWNSDAVTESMLNNGYDKEAANMFTLSTCVEITPIGSSAVSVTSPYINLLKVFLDSFDKCHDNCSFEDIFSLFRDEFNLCAKKYMLQENLWQLERKRNSTDPVRTSLLIHDCIENAMSHDSGGARYNTLMPDILGMQNVTESLNCIYRLIFEQKKISLSKYKKALQSNFQGEYQSLRTYIINRMPHFGTSDKVSDDIQKMVSDMVLDTYKDLRTVRGAKVIPGAFSYRDHELHGKSTPASPDGRLSGAPLNDGSCPVQGYDDKGPTMSLMSTASWEPSRFLGGTSVNVQLNENVAEEKILSLIEGYLKTKGAQLQFNIVNAETLKDAKMNPHLHRDLLVRIGGYSDFFVKLPERLQDEVISRTHNVI
ncbi:MAG: hypothetical protein E7396_06695 [Ruminococcaceae bacterium]|nr:hypothetical protein [Oscillospiraceae bacterium]